MKLRDILSKAGPFLGLIIVLVIFGFLVGPQFFRPANLELIARQTAIVCVAALGMTMVIVSAGIDLSVGSIIALSTVVIAVMLRDGFSPSIAALGGMAGRCRVCMSCVSFAPSVLSQNTIPCVGPAGSAVARWASKRSSICRHTS